MFCVREAAGRGTGEGGRVGRHNMHVHGVKRRTTGFRRDKAGGGRLPVFAIGPTAKLLTNRNMVNGEQRRFEWLENRLGQLLGNMTSLFACDRRFLFLGMRNVGMYHLSVGLPWLAALTTV